MILINKKPKGFEIILSGADGSGKTTIARFIYLYTSSEGYNPCYYWIRGSHLIASILLRLLSKFNSFKGMCNPYYKVCIPTNLKRLWSLIEFVNLLPFVFLRFLLRRACFIIGDRGILDSTIWIATTLNWPAFLKTPLGRFMLSLALKENIIYLYTDLQILLQRCDVPRRFLINELALYNVLAQYYANLYIDTVNNKLIQVVGDIIKNLSVS